MKLFKIITFSEVDLDSIHQTNNLIIFKNMIFFQQKVKKDMQKLNRVQEKGSQRPQLETKDR